MAASESDFSGIDDDGVDAYLGDEWASLVLAIKAMTAYFVAKTNAGTEPTDVLTGISWGQGTDHFKWRILGSGGNLLVQENTGTEGTPAWTTRTTFSATTGVDHGGLGGLSDDDHTLYSLADGTRAITGSQQFDVNVKTDTIIEKTSATGVTIDSCLIKDGIAADSTLHAGVAETAHSLADGTRAITGSQQFDTNVKTDTIIEKTSATGVTIDGTLIKDNDIKVATITENGAAAGVTIDSCLIKDGAAANSLLLAGTAETAYPLLAGTRAFTGAQTFSHASGLLTDVITEETGGAGVTIDGTLIKDNDIKVATITEQSAAAGVTIDSCLIKDGAAANALLLGGTAEASLSVADSVLFNGTADTIYPLLDGTRAVTGNQVFSHASGIKLDDIVENTGAAGVTIDSCLIKDGTVADSLLLNGASTYSRLDVTEEYTKAKGHTEVAVAVATATFTFDFEASNYFEAALSDNVTTVTINNTGKPGSRVIKVTQGTAGSKAISGWPTTVNWVDGTVPTITAAANSVDFITIVVDSSGNMYGFVAQDFS